MIRGGSTLGLGRIVSGDAGRIDSGADRPVSKYRPNYLMRSTIVLSAAQENSVFLSVSARNQEIRDSRTSSILKILSGS